MNSEKIDKLKGLIVDSLVPLINHDYVLLDVPNHRNIGDNMIWEGELIFLKRFVHYKLKYSANVLNVDLDKIDSEDVILFHGGGNFGDLYPECQRLRLEVVKKYPNNRIIFFPQTVFYNNSELMKLECEILNSHSNLYMCMRDQDSYMSLLPFIDKEKLILLPDMAFFLDLKPRIVNNTFVRRLLLMRTDNEVGNIDMLNALKSCLAVEVKDWPTYYNNYYIRCISNILIEKKKKLSILFQKKSIFSWLVDPQYGLNLRGNRLRYINMGIEFMQKYDEIYTTRLHGLILGILLGKRVFIVDNNYGKCKHFYNTWLTDFNNIILL